VGGVGVPEKAGAGEDGDGGGRPGPCLAAWIGFTSDAPGLGEDHGKQKIAAEDEPVAKGRDAALRVPGVDEGAEACHKQEDGLEGEEGVDPSPEEFHAGGRLAGVQGFVYHPYAVGVEGPEIQTTKM